MTLDELRAFCLGLAGTHEKETWGDAEHAGDVTFRVKDKIYLITGQEGGSAFRAQSGNEIPLTGDPVFTLGKVPPGYFKVVEKHCPVLGARESCAVDHRASFLCSLNGKVASASEPAAFRERPTVKPLSPESGILLYQADTRSTGAPEGRVPGY